MADDEPTHSGRRWYHYIPLVCAVLIILSPSPSLIAVLTTFQLKTLHSPLLVATHTFFIYTLTFLAFCSLIVCVVRDPGPVGPAPAAEDDSDETTLTDALTSLKAEEDDYDKPGRWCRRCWAPKPQRAHHCSICDRCVLKMDHHCPWLGAKCIGHRTYPSFVHFICTSTLLSLYVMGVGISAMYYVLTHPYDLDDRAPLHILFLIVLGFVFTMTMGSFAGYHLYLISTNQTTIENLSPFLLLRHISSPPVHAPTDASPYYFPPPSPAPPAEHELSYKQRRLVQRAHERVRLYDLGLRRNWAAVYGVPSTTKPGVRWRLILGRVLWGGGAALGDGRSFPLNPRADTQLAELALQLYGPSEQERNSSRTSASLDI